MAIYFLDIRIIGRSQKRNIVASAAYRAGERLLDERHRCTHNFTTKRDVVHAEILLPEGAPASFADRATLWNAVDARERRKDSRLAREIQLTLPRELARDEAIALARDFVREQFVARGMIADLCIHMPNDVNGERQPHAHVLLTMRHVSPSGFGYQATEWGRRSELLRWREAWAEHVNRRLAMLDLDLRIDHRRLEAQGLPLEPQDKVGPARRRDECEKQMRRAAANRAAARRNGERLIAEPELALRAITLQQSTFSRAELARFVHRYSDGAEQFTTIMAKVDASPELVRLGAGEHGEDRFTTRTMIDIEASLERSAVMLAGQRRHPVDRAVDAPGLSDEQRAALAELLRPEGLSIVVGVAGSGKSAMLGAARQAWEAGGYRVQGAALSAVAAQGLEASAGIASRTIASFEHAWADGYDQLTPADVLVVDESGLVGSRQMAALLREAVDAGAKVVLVGDPQQLQAIEAGAAFRALVERHGAAELVDVHRQRVDWQRAATIELATGRTAAALARYANAGAVKAHASHAAALGALVDRWAAAARQESSIMLAATRDDAQALNEAARERLRREARLGVDVEVVTSRGSRAFAAGDTLLFLRNDRELGLRNGQRGEVVRVLEGWLVANVDGRQVGIDLKAYPHVDHGYALTIHKAQGMTVDRAFVLAAPSMDRHSAYVALSRHRENVELYYGSDVFASQPQLVRRLSRERLKDMTLDYAAAFAERHGIPARTREPSRLDGLRLEPREPALHEASRQKAPAATADPSRGVTRESGRLRGKRLSLSRGRDGKTGPGPGRTRQIERGPEPPDLAPERGRPRDLEFER
jgi:Ti-type conjugative transfer relaxase TraA